MHPHAHPHQILSLVMTVVERVVDPAAAAAAGSFGEGSFVAGGIAVVVVGDTAVGFDCCCGFQLFWRVC